MTKTPYVLTGFDGAVTLKDWYRHWDNRLYMGIVGKVSIIEAKVAVGFDLADREANWLARIDGPAGLSLNILGCQVRSIATGTLPKAPSLSPEYLDLRLVA